MRPRRRLRAPANLFWVLVILFSEAFLAKNSSEECGTRPVLDEIETGIRIIGGRDAQRGAWPWQVSLQVYRLGLGYVHICGGCLITNISVLTAAHCAKRGRIPAIWRAVTGLHYLYRHTNQTIKSRVKTITVHSHFSTSTFVNDIAMFILSKPVTYSGYVQPVCLPNTSLLLNEETTCYISGWGMQMEKGSGSQILQEAEVKIIPLSICNSFEWYGGMVPKNSLCAGSESGHVDSCQGTLRYVDSNPGRALWQEQTNILEGMHDQNQIRRKEGAHWIRNNIKGYTVVEKLLSPLCHLKDPEWLRDGNPKCKTSAQMGAAGRQQLAV